MYITTNSNYVLILSERIKIIERRLFNESGILCNTPAFSLSISTARLAVRTKSRQAGSPLPSSPGPVLAEETYSDNDIIPMMSPILNSDRPRRRRSLIREPSHRYSLQSRYRRLDAKSQDASISGEGSVTICTARAVLLPLFYFYILKY